MFSGIEYPDSGVGSEPEGRCDGRNEEGDGDSDAESLPQPPQLTSYLTDEKAMNGKYSEFASSHDITTENSEKSRPSR